VGVRFDYVGPPFDSVTSLISRLEDGGHDRVIAGYKGPWFGGWSDIVYASTYGAFDDLVGESVDIASFARHTNSEPVRTKYVDANMESVLNENYDEVVEKWKGGGFHAEMVWAMILTANGFRLQFYQFCDAIRWRVDVRAAVNKDGAPAGEAELIIRSAQVHSCDMPKTLMSPTPLTASPTSSADESPRTTNSSDDGVIRAWSASECGDDEKAQMAAKSKIKIVGLPPTTNVTVNATAMAAVTLLTPYEAFYFELILVIMEAVLRGGGWIR
jgi:hypothetical protein